MCGIDEELVKNDFDDDEEQEINDDKINGDEQDELDHDGLLLLNGKELKIEQFI